MKLLIHGRNLDVTPALRDYTETKLDRAIHHFNDLVQEADVHLSVARNPRVPQQTAEVTVFAHGIWLGEGGAEGATPLLDEDGAALVIHAGADDYESDPAGAAGDRVACAVLEPEA